MTITVVRAGGRDEHGDPQPSTEHDIADCDVAPRTDRRASTEDNVIGETVVVGLTVYGPYDADILATDQVRLTGTDWDGLYDVVGEPGRWKNPFDGHEAGTEIALTRTG